MSIRPYRGRLPVIDPSAFIDDSAQVIGDVVIGAESSVWMQTVIRGDVNYIRIGARSNVQDGTIVHVQHDTHPTIIGHDVTIGHGAIVHGCTISDRVLVGIGATIMDGCEIGENSIIAGQAFLKEGTIIPPNSIVMGAPGKAVRERNSAGANAFNAWMYRENAAAYVRGEHRLWSTAEFGEAARVERARLAALYGG